MKKMQCDSTLQDDLGRDWRAAIVRTLLAVALGASLLTPVSAAMVFEQLPLDRSDPFASISGEQSADGFTLSTTTAVTGLTWWGSYSEDPATLPAHVFSVRIFADNGSGAPATATNPSEAISMQQLTRFPTDLFDKTGARVYRFFDGDPWLSDLNPPTGNLAFQVSGGPGTAIPLPGSLLLLLSALAGLGVAKPAVHARDVHGLAVRGGPVDRVPALT